MKNRDEIQEEIKRREYYNSLAPFPVYDTEILNDFKTLLKMNYENEPVTFCKTCLSLKIKMVPLKKSDGSDGKPIDYCAVCSNTELETVQLSEWEELYFERYGESFLKSE